MPLLVVRRGPVVAGARSLRAAAWLTSLFVVGCDRLEERAVSERDPAGDHAELARMYDEDQSDRRGDIDWSVVSPRDDARRARARQLLESGSVTTAQDLWRAAMLFQHGRDIEDFRFAREL